MIDVPVLIAGGGPVGLTASLLLSQHGVRSLLVERHPGTAILPKSRGINARTMEMYRQCGAEEAIRAAGLAPQRAGLIVWAETLAGREIERRVPGRATPQARAVTPSLNCLCAQDDLEPVLRRIAEATPPGELRFGTELISVHWNSGGAGGTLLDRASRIETPFHARYVIAADGAQSRLRRLTGVAMRGEEAIYDSINILFSADLQPWTAHRPAALYFIEQPDLRGTFLTINGTDRWGFLIHSLSQYGHRPEDYTREHCAALVRQAAGVPDLAVEVLGISAWEASAIVAERYRHGPIFLAGDAAHEMPPTGGFGLNTGVQDVHNLAWKLAAVLNGDAGESLLDTYHAERQPLAEVITRNSLANALSMGRTSRPVGAVLPRREFLNEQGLIFGAAYVSDAVIDDGTPPPDAGDGVTDYVPSARPGCRAPHAWLQRGAERISTIDLFGRHFTLLAGPDGEGWRKAAGHLALPAWPPLTIHVIGDGALVDADGSWAALYGLHADGAVLVRPDGHVAWRSAGAVRDPRRLLQDVFDRLLGRSRRIATAADQPREPPMSETAQPIVARLGDAPAVSFGPLSQYQMLIGQTSLPLFTGVQTCKPGYQTPEHFHPYAEYLFILEGRAEAWLVGQEDRVRSLGPGDMIALPPDTPHVFRNPGPGDLRLLGIHANPERIVRMADGDRTLVGPARFETPPA